MKRKREAISFKPIPGFKGGYICLTVYPPGTWMDNTEYMASVGGCGIARAKNLTEIKQLLFETAQRDLERRIDKLRAEALHYVFQLTELRTNGLQPVKTAAKTRKKKS